MSVDTREDDGAVAHDGVKIGRCRELSIRPENLVPSTTHDPAIRRIALRILAYALERRRERGTATKIDLQTLLAEAEHVSVRIDQAGEEWLAVAVDYGRAGGGGGVAIEAADAPIDDDHPFEFPDGAVRGERVTRDIADVEGLRRTWRKRAYREEYCCQNVRTHALNSVSKSR